MKKMILLLAIIAFSSSIFSQDGFRGYEWGTSKEHIERIEGEPTHVHPRGFLKWTIDTLLGEEVMVRYRYENSLLESGEYTHISSSASDSFSFFRKIESMLAEKYGYSEDNRKLLEDSELIGLMLNEVSYSIYFHGNIELVCFNNTLHDNRKPYNVGILYFSKEKENDTGKDVDKL